MFKTLAMTALVLGLATPVFADDATPQTGSGTQSPVGDDHAKTWAPNVNDTFFTDSTGNTMREASDVKMRWSKLTPEEQDKVRADCKDMKAGSMGGMADACKWVNAM